jgi:hypothetical protein
MTPSLLIRIRLVSCSRSVLSSIDVFGEITRHVFILLNYYKMGLQIDFIIISLLNINQKWI